MKNLPLIFVFAILVLSGFVYFLHKQMQSKPMPTSNISSLKTIKVGQAEVKVKLAQTSQEITQGLSGQEKLADNEGLLFVMPQNSSPIFWMKDMRFALDMIRIDDNKVVQIDENVPNPPSDTPEYKLDLYPSNQPIDYVLEVNAGWSKQNNIKVGDKVII